MKRKTDNVNHPAHYADNQVKQDDGMDESKKQIIAVCDEIKDMLLDKNRKYGNSALCPVRVFSKADTMEQIKVRIDDKLSRIKNEQGDDDEDVYKDLAGYIVLLIIARGKQNEK